MLKIFSHLFGNKKIKVIIGLSVLLLYTFPAYGAITDNVNVMERDTINVGGGSATFTNYSIIGTIGQSSPIGVGSVGQFGIYGGFWGIPYSPSPPKIYYFTPGAGPKGRPVRIFGENYSPDVTKNTVKFNGKNATVHGVNSNGTQIVTKVPSGASTGSISVTVNGVTATSSRAFRVRGRR